VPKPVAFAKGESVHLTFNVDEILTEAPELLGLHGAAVTSWSWAEQQYQNVRAVLEITDADPKLSKFDCPRSTPAQLQRLESAAKGAIPSWLRELFLVALKVAKLPSIDRNTLSHGLVAYCPIRPTGLVIFKQEDQQKLYRSTFAPSVKFGRIDGNSEDFEAIAREVVQNGRLYERDDYLRCIAANKLSADILLWLPYLGSNDFTIVNLGIVKLLKIPEVAREFEAAA
jgi:hypothetical protein